VLVHSCDCDFVYKIQVAVLFFNDPFTWLKGLGLAIIIFGVSLFNLYK
jgi:solute carrier family 35 protein C2